MRASEWLNRRGDNTWLAGELGVSVQTVCRWKSGKNIPKGRYIRRIAELSHGRVTADDFYQDSSRAES
jgi:transcriptional regulator with XRE-family HTH domain